MAELKDKYDHQKLDAKWQKYWEKQKLFLAKETGKKKYVLDMFPYPSGEGLHVGHPEGYIASDIISHYYRLNNFNVLHPMGFDAFGLPAENAAIKKGIPPAENTVKNIARFKEQLNMIGFSYDWSRQVVTSDPEYYKWTQWLFLELYKNGLAYQKEAYVNWCPNDKTVLANEQVVGGCCERCGTAVVQEKKKQWFLKITDFAEALLSGLDKLDWPDSTKEIQRNWIGKSEGTDLEFKVKNSETTIKVFTTRPDTLFGATYMVVAPEYTGLDKIVIDEYKKEVKKYQETTAKKTELDRIAETKDKTGVFTGAYAINPANNAEIPIWVADYVLAGYGYGAVMCVPAHDERDFAFAQKFNLPIQQVIAPLYTTDQGVDAVRSDKETIRRKMVTVILKHWSEDKVFCLNWEKFNWKSFILGGVEEGETFEEAATREAIEESGYQNIKSVKKIGFETHSNFFARHKDVNRYSMADCFVAELADGEYVEPAEEHVSNHKGEWVDAKKVMAYVNLKNNIYYADIFLNGERPFVGQGVVINSGKFDGLSSLEAGQKITKQVKGEITIKYRLRDWLVSRQRYWGAPIPMFYDKNDQPIPIQEKDLPVLLPTDVEFRPTGESPLSYSKEFKKLPTGYPAAVRREYDTLDTFVCSSWYYLRYADPKNIKEFASPDKLKYWLPVDVYVGGAEHSTGHLIFARFITKVLHKLGYINFDEPFLKLRHQGMILGENGEKMSKSKGNVINPDEAVEGFGADALRMYEMFMGPFDQAKPWSTAGIEGIKKFLDRVYRLVQERVKLPANDSKEGDLHRLMIKITADIEEFHFNTAVSAFMIFINNAIADGKSNSWLEDFVILLAPFAPHLAEELWQGILGKKESIFLAKWPVVDPKKAKLDKITIIIQEQGKKRGGLEIPAGADENMVVNLIKQDAKLAVLAENKHYKFVPDRIINFY